MSVEFSRAFSEWLSDVVTVEPHLGAGFDGDVFGAPVTVGDVLVEEQRRLVRGSDGNEVVSETTLYVEHDEPALGLNARVTLPSGEVTRVLRRASMTEYGVTDHVVVNLA